MNNFYYMYNAGTNQLSGRTYDGTEFSYDPQGNLTGDAVTNVDDIEYNYQNLPVSISTNGSNIYNVYSDDAKRLEKKVDTDVICRYIYGLDGQVIAEYDGNDDLTLWRLGSFGFKEPSGAKYYYIKDHIGNVRVTVDEQGSIVTKDDYYPFGLRMEGYSYNSGNSFDRLKYSAKELDEEAGLEKYHFGWRDYNPTLGRWHVMDPAMQFASPYVFNGNTAINGYDSDGRFGIFAVLAMAYTAYTTMDGFQKGGIDGAVYGFMQGVKGSVVTYASMGIGTSVGLYTGSAMLGSLAGSAVNSTTNYLWSGGDADFSLSSGPFSYNFSKGKFGISNPFDNNWRSWKGIRRGIVEWLSWAPFLYDTRNVPGMKYVRFGNGLPNTLAGLIYAKIHGDTYSHFDWNDLIFYFNTKNDAGSSALGHTIATGSGILRGMKENKMSKSFLQTIAHEKTHVLQSGVFGPLFMPFYSAFEVAGYAKHFVYKGNLKRPWGFPDTNLFEIWAYMRAEQVSGILYNNVYFENLWWRKPQ